MARAVDQSRVPIIGNGDVWSAEDIDALFEMSKCHGIMCGRGALKTPWLAKYYVNGQGHNEAFMLTQRAAELEEYFDLLRERYLKSGKSIEFVLARFKSFSRNLFDDYPDYETIRGHFLRSQNLQQFLCHLNAL